MKTTFGRLASLALVASAVATLAAGAFGQEKVKIQKIEAADGEGRVTVVVNTEDGATAHELPGYWVGIGGEGAGEALLAQLKLEAGLVVHDVIDDSPAAKAGVQKHDIVLRFGEKKVGAIEDLVEALRGSKGDEVEVVLLRGGEKQTVKIQPEKRPAGAGHDAGEHHEIVRSWLMKMGEGEGGQDMRLFSFRPGMVLGHAQAIQLPGNTSITIRKDSEGPAKIEVTHDGKTYQVTDENVKELPENLRGPIEKMLKGGNQMLHFEHLPNLPEHLEKQLRVRIHGAEDKAGAKDGDKNVEERQTIIVPRVRVEAAAAAAAGKSIEAQLEMLLQKIEKIEKELSTLKDK